MRAIFLLAVLIQSGCVVSVKHLSDPRVDDDGYNLVCGGIEKDIHQFRIRGDVCGNLAPNHGELLELSIEYRFNRDDRS